MYNHVNIYLDYHNVENEGQRIVGFSVEPLSITHKFKDDARWDGKGAAPALATCPSDSLLSYEDTRNKGQRVLVGDVVYSYGVTWRESQVRWASRWDVYLSMNHAVPDKVHWFSIINSILIVVFLAFMVGMILVRSLYKDITAYNKVPTDEEKAEEREETGWKLIHADVFRPPTEYPMLFSVVVGTGVQRCTLLTATLFPGIAFAAFIVLDLLVWSYGSTGAVPVLSMFALLTLWFGISVPLVFLGAYFGYKKDPLEFPVVTSNIPRPLPPQPAYLHPGLVMMLGGVLPFGACFVEMFFIMSSIWMDHYYYVFGFLLDYRWWWRSVYSAGSTALYVFLYSVFYYSRLESNLTITYVLYFAYMALVSMGTVGFFACLYFNYQIYASIKVD
eukprot:gene24784-29948_t